MSWLITGREAGSLGLLDQYAGAAAAYSLRSLTLYYTGPVVRVRRSSDNTEADFTATQVSDGTMVDWVGAGNDGYVCTWYDQSGNGRNAEQTTTANQPQIVSSGNLIIKNGKPSALFNGTSSALLANSLATVFTGSAKPLSCFCVFSDFTLSSSSVALLGFGNSSNNNEIKFIGSAGNVLLFLERDISGSNTLVVQGGTPTGQNCISAFSNGVNSRALFLNGLSIGSNDVTAGSIALNTFSIGALARTTIGNYAAANIQEILIYSSNQSSSRTLIEASINAHYAIY